MRKVLVADDDRFMVQTLCDVLSLHGWETHGVASGEEAFSAVADEPFSCVIMDIKMDGQDGFSTMQRLKRRQASTPVFLMTAYTADELMAEARRNGTLQAIDDKAPVADVARDIVHANARGAPVLVLGRGQGFLDNLSDVLATQGLATYRAGKNLDLLTEFERVPPTVTMVRIPHARGPDGQSYMITGLDAGVWVALSSHLPHLASFLSHTVSLADGFFRKPIAIPQLVKHLDGVAAI